MVTISLDPESDEAHYLAACASIRGIGVRGLVERLITTIAREQLVLSVLDDDSRQQRRKWERRSRRT